MDKTVRKIVQTPSAYSYHLLLKQLLHTPIVYAPDQGNRVPRQNCDTPTGTCTTGFIAWLQALPLSE